MTTNNTSEKPNLGVRGQTDKDYGWEDVVAAPSTIPPLTLPTNSGATTEAPPTYEASMESRRHIQAAMAHCTHPIDESLYAPPTPPSERNETTSAETSPTQATDASQQAREPIKSLSQVAENVDNLRHAHRQLSANVKMLGRQASDGDKKLEDWIQKTYEYAETQIKTARSAFKGLNSWRQRHLGEYEQTRAQVHGLIQSQLETQTREAQLHGMLRQQFELTREVAALYNALDERHQGTLTRLEKVEGALAMSQGNVQKLLLLNTVQSQKIDQLTASVEGLARRVEALEGGLAIDDKDRQCPSKVLRDLDEYLLDLNARVMFRDDYETDVASRIADVKDQLQLWYYLAPPERVVYYKRGGKECKQRVCSTSEVVNLFKDIIAGAEERFDSAVKRVDEELAQLKQEDWRKHGDKALADLEECIEEHNGCLSDVQDRLEALERTVRSTENAHADESSAAETSQEAPGEPLEQTVARPYVLEAHRSISGKHVRVRARVAHQGSESGFSWVDSSDGSVEEPGTDGSAASASDHGPCQSANDETDPAVPSMTDVGTTSETAPGAESNSEDSFESESYVVLHA